MNPSQFRAPEAGRLIRTIGGHLAFVPAPLPVQLTYTRDLVLALSEADSAIGELSGLARHLPNPQLLIAPYVRREAVLSSRIEGTKASLSDLLLDEVRESESLDSADVQEVRNYVTALNYGVARLATLPLSLRLVRELHLRLMNGVRGEQAKPGEFRTSQNWIGAPGSQITQATYVPPPPERLGSLLDNWEKFLHLRGEFPDLIQCALMHEQFEAIHPFLDGNGRVGRLMITLLLIERQRLPQPLLYLSAYLEEHRSEYYERLQRVRTDGDWLGWLHFFLMGVTQTAQAALNQARRLLDLRQEYRSRLRQKPRALALVDELFNNPYLTTAHAAQALQVSLPTARQLIGLLVSEGILVETTGREWGRVYLARAIFDTMEGNVAPRQDE